MSKQEDILFNAIKSIYNLEIVRNFRPDFLQNERTGKNLEIDIWLPIHNVGFEYQGAIHFQRVERYRNNPDKSRHHDMIKYELTEAKVTSRWCIVEIFEQDLNGNVSENICKRLLNTQEYLFDKLQFIKCARLEIVYASFLGLRNSQGAKYTKQWFSMCAKYLLGKEPDIQKMNNIAMLDEKRSEFIMPNRPVLTVENAVIVLKIGTKYSKFAKHRKNQIEQRKRNKEYRDGLLKNRLQNLN